MQRNLVRQSPCRVLACWLLLSVLLGVSAEAQAQSAEGMRVQPSPLTSARWPVSLLDAGLQIETGALKDALKRKQVRYRTMAVTGYTLVALGLITTVATGAGQIYRRQDNSNGSYSCGPYLTPFLTVPGIVAGLGVGLRGTFAGRRLSGGHPELGAPDNTRARRTGAIVGTIFSMGAAALSVPGFFCNS